MEEILNTLESQIDGLKQYNDPMNEADWGFEVGVLITGEQAIKIIEFIKSKQD